MPATDAAISAVFNAEFATGEGTVLRGGAAEPSYEPPDPLAGDGTGTAIIRFRADYASSALHEVAHWCIAGRERRALPDYGYWYAPDGRDALQQAEFLRVEARPQALEWCFSQAAGLPFCLSLDNLDAPPNAEMARRFAEAVLRNALDFRCGLPPRGERFFAALAARFRPGLRREALHFCIEDLL